MLIELENILKEYKDNKKTLKELQEEFDYLDYLNIETSIYFGDEIESGIYEEIEMEIWRENDFYMKIDNSFNIIKYDEEHTRICSECKSKMTSGYITGNFDYYCSDKCLHKHYTEEEWKELHEKYEHDYYWTSWEE